MKYPKSNPLIYIAFIVSLVSLFVFYLVAYTNLKKNLSQTEDEKVILKMMLHLDRYQSALTNVEYNCKPHSIEKNKLIARLFDSACNIANNEIIELKQLTGKKNIPDSKIEKLDSLNIKHLNFLHTIVSLGKQGNADSATNLLVNWKGSDLRKGLMNQYDSISTYGRTYLKLFQERRFSNSQNIVLIMGILSLITLSLLVFIFWRLLVQTKYKDRLVLQNKIYSEIINNTSESITISDESLNVTYCNAATANLYKLSPKQIIGKKLDDVFKSRFSKEKIEEQASLLKTHGRWRGEIKNTDSSGKFIDLITTINSIKDEQGNTTGFFAINTDISELKQTQEEVELLAASLKKSNETLEARVNEQTALVKEIVERVKDGFIATDINYMVTYANSTITTLLDENGALIAGRNVLELFTQIIEDYNKELLSESLEKQQMKSFEFKKNNTGKWYEVSIFPSYNGLSIYFKDITTNKKAEEEIYKSKLLNEFTSKVNDLVLHAENAEKIYSEICKIATQTGGLLFSWIGFPDKETGHIKPRFTSGDFDEYLAIGNILTTDSPEGKGPTGMAYREGRYYYCNDIATDPSMLPWRYSALKFGFMSSISLPIKIEGNVECVLTMYASQPFFFTEEEISLLVRVSENISYAINAFNIAEKRRIAEIQLKKVSQAVEQSSASVVITDLDGKIEYVNPAFSKLTGYSFEEAIGQNPKILKSGYTSYQEYTRLWDNITHKHEWHGEFCNKKKNGEIYWEYAIISPIVNNEGVITHFVAVKENITERKKMAEEQKELLRIFENTTAYVATSDLNKNFLYINKAMKNALEVDEYEDVTKLSIAEFKSAKGTKIMADFTKALETEGIWTGESCYQSRKGKEIPVWQVVILHKNEKGEPTHFSTTALDISKNKEAERELHRLNSELRELSTHLRDINETDKKEIAREIHDELGQGLTALKFGVSWIKRHIHDDKNIVEQKIDDLLNDITETMKSFRRIYTALHPAILEELGLHGSIQWLVNSFSKSSNIPVEFASDIEYEQIELDKSLALYRVVQESLTNIMRYAKAYHVSISIQKQDDFTLILTIEDDGIGFNSALVDNKQHHGLLGMRERMYAVHGTFKISSIPKKGTIVYAEIPLL
jgi:PAS domain S-box-containing protein